MQFRLGKINVNYCVFQGQCRCQSHFRLKLDEMFIASNMRDGDLDDLFAHENQACPHALSQMGTVRLGQKSDLVGV